MDIIFLDTLNINQIKISPNTILLKYENWDDFGFKTIFFLNYIDEQEKDNDIGYCKIGLYKENEYDVNLQNLAFTKKKYKLSDNKYFSLGQDESYYENLMKLGVNKCYQILTIMNDLVLNETLYEEAQKYDVFQKSLIRNLSLNTIVHQFRNIIHNRKINHFSFKYVYPKCDTQYINNELNFQINYSDKSNVTINNIYAIIGSNGLGKSHLLYNLINSAINYNKEKYGEIIFDNNSLNFSRIIFISYSVFDQEKFDINTEEFINDRIPYDFIGINNNFKYESVDDEAFADKILENNSDRKLKDSLTKSFLYEFGMLIRNGKLNIWINALNILNSDYTLRSSFINFINDKFSTFNNSIKEGNKIFKDFLILYEKLSTGHKIIIFTILKIVNKIHENCLLLFDEPELHLHPPLISAYINSLTYVLSERNAIGIIATHSPVVLQELKKDNVFKFNRINEFIKISNPKIETYGENIGSITNDVFNLEIKNSGYYKNLKELVSTGLTYEDILNKLNNNLGDEGKSILNMLIHYRDNSNL